MSKGLEFNTVFLVGMEENIFPHFMALKDRDVEEERRLCYVCITRAMNKLYITNAEERRSFGKTIKNLPSRFISEIPKDLVKKV
jgi:DNA helicase-2/ATP-dependent DNA helicase PcrA